MRKVMFLLAMLSLCAVANTQKPNPPAVQQNRQTGVLVEEKTGLRLKTPDRKLSEKEKGRMKKELLNFGVDSLFLDSLFARSDFGVYSMQEVKKPRNYEEYRERLNIDEKIKHGIKFVEENWEELQKLEEKFGVSKYYIAATLGIETDYGRYMGEYNAVYALLTMYNRAGTWKRKQRWARQMIDFLIMCEELGLDEFNVPSSWAGAIGLGQWMPSTWKKAFKDGSGDGKKDVFDLEDVMYSIAAHYARYKDVGKAIFSYNPSQRYVRATNEIANGIEIHFLLSGKE